MKFNKGDRVVNAWHTTPVGSWFSSGTILEVGYGYLLVRYDDGFTERVNPAAFILENHEDYLPGTDGDLT